MFKNVTNLASGTGSVAWHRGTGMYVVTRWVKFKDHIVLVEKRQSDGTVEGDKALRAWARETVKRYAAEN